MGLIRFFVFLLLLQESLSFTVKPLAVSSLGTRCISNLPRFADGQEEGATESSEPQDEAPEEDPVEAYRVASTDSSPPVRQVDPLVAALTRNDAAPPTTAEKTINAPLLGEIPIDGSFVVLVPAAIFAVLGVLVGIVVAFNARDDFVVPSLTDVSDGINEAAYAKANTQVVDGVCRGICSAQEDDLDGLRTFMEGLRK